MMESEPLFESGDDALDRIRGLLHERRKRTRRPLDDVWDALGRAVGWTPAAQDGGARARFGRVVAELDKIGATPALIAAHAARYRSIYPGAALTPEALLKHWSATAPPAGGRHGALYQSDAFREQEGEPIADLAEAARTARAALERSMAERSSKMEST